MGQQRLILAIGRIERALSRLEKAERPSPAPQGDPELQQRHERLKAETQAAIREIDQLLSANGR